MSQASPNLRAANEIMQGAVENIDDVGKSAQELRKSREDLTRLMHQIELGKDPALGTGGSGMRAFRVDEAITGSRIENSIGRKLQRVPNDKDPGDWYDPK